jgi:hypothetical protein
MSAELELLPCPTGGCSLPAEVMHRTTTNSPGGDLDIIALVCILGHTYAGPESFVTQAAGK